MHMSNRIVMETVLEQEKQRQTNLCADMGEYNHNLSIKLIKQQQNETNKDLALKWDTALFGNDCKLSTRASKLNTLNHLIKWAKKQDLATLTKEDLIAFKQHLTTATFSKKDNKLRNYKPTTINGMLAIIKGFYKWLGKEETMAWYKIKRQTTGKLNAEQILTQEEVLAMVTAAGNKRNKALILCTWESGARAAEILNLKIGAVNIEENIASLTLIGKTGSRPAFLVSSLPSLVEWLEEHPEKNNSQAWLWPKKTRNSNGGRMTNSTLRLICIKAAKKAKITKPAHSHCLRHSRATFAARQQLNEMQMRKMFGWSPISTMPSVYTSLSGIDTRNAAMQLAGKALVEKEVPLEPKTCIRCGTIAPLDGKICKNCFAPLTAEAAAEKEEKEKQKMVQMIEAALREKGVIKN